MDMSSISRKKKSRVIGMISITYQKINGGWI